MKIFENPIIVSKITAVLFVPYGYGKPVHKNRPAHGFALNIGCESAYRFSTGETLVCHADEMIYLPKGANYTVTPRSADRPEGAGTYAINFLIEGVHPDYTPQIFRVKAKEELLSAFSKATNASIKKDASFHEDCFINLYKILKIVRKESLHYSPREETLKLLAPALKYIEENYTQESVFAPTLAKLCGISETYLRQLFNDAFGVPPMIYVRNRRIKYAKELLRSQEYPVTEVALLCGFNDPAYFSREFKKATGLSPKKYQIR